MGLPGENRAFATEKDCAAFKVSFYRAGRLSLRADDEEMHLERLGAWLAPCLNAWLELLFLKH